MNFKIKKHFFSGAFYKSVTSAWVLWNNNLINNIHVSGGYYDADSAYFMTLISHD